MAKPTSRTRRYLSLVAKAIALSIPIAIVAMIFYATHQIASPERR